MKPDAALVRRAALVALAAAGLLLVALAVAHRTARPAGLELRLSGPGGALTLPVDAVDVRDVRDGARKLGLPVEAEWRGVWHVPGPGRHRLVADSDGATSVAVDGAPVLEARGSRERADVGLREGAHPLVVRYATRHEPARLVLTFAAPGGDRRPLGAPDVFPATPHPAQVAAGRLVHVLRPAAAAAWLLLALLGAWHVSFLPPASPLRRTLRVAVPAAVVLYAGALRFEALVGRYWHDAPPLALAAERAISGWRPAELRWEPSETHHSGDPWHYYLRARSMGSFYEPHVREPVFPWTARQLGRWLGDRPLVVDAASALFSTLAVLATFLLGLAALGWTAGVGAALLLALDLDVIWWGVEGFRDDAFMAFTLLTTAALVRLRERPTFAWTLATGLAAGLALLSRLSAFSFLLPALAWSALPGGEGARPRRTALALAFALAMVVAGPYMASCALAWGDPFYAVNHHTRFYRSRSGSAFDSDMTWSAWLRRGFAPAELAATGAEGLTTFPFRTKWRGLDPVSVTLRRVLAWLSVAGLVLMAFSARGRLLLVVLLSSLLPYAFTWRIPGGSEWRFTMHAYAFYLLAAMAAVPLAAGWIRTRSGSARLPWRGTAPCPPPG